MRHAVRTNTNHMAFGPEVLDYCIHEPGEPRFHALLKACPVWCKLRIQVTGNVFLYTGGSGVPGLAERTDPSHQCRACPADLRAACCGTLHNTSIDTCARTYLRGQTSPGGLPAPLWHMPLVYQIGKVRQTRHLDVCEGK